jgi:hypothetical protein
MISYEDGMENFSPEQIQSKVFHLKQQIKKNKIQDEFGLLKALEKRNNIN